MFEIIFAKLYAFINWILSICYWTTTYEVTPSSVEERMVDSFPAYVFTYERTPDVVPTLLFTEEDKRKSKLGVKRLKQKQLYALITKAKYLEIRSMFTDKPMPTNQMLNRPLDEEDELFDKVKDYVICNMPEKNMDIWKPRK